MNPFGRTFTAVPAMIAFSAIGTNATAADLNAAGKVSAVTVYADRAMVVRTVRVNLQQGEHAITVPGLPAGLSEDSLSAGVISGPVRLLGLDLRRQFASETMGK